MQSPSEVINNTLRRKKADRIGCMDSIWGDTLTKWVTQGYPTNADGKPIDPVDQFKFDIAPCGGWFNILPIRMKEDEVVQETDEWVIKRNGAGASLKWWKNKSGTPEHVDFRMTSREIWDRDYRSHLLQLDEQRMAFDWSTRELPKRRQQGLATQYGNIFVWENMRQSLGDICLYESMLLDPEWIHDYNRVYTDFFKKHYQLLFDRCGLPDHMWMYEDLGYKGSLFCSPDMYERLIFPYFRELVEFFHAKDLPVVLHTCGLVGPALDLIVGAGFDALNPMEVKAGNDPVDIARRYGDKLAFVGGLDERVLESHDRGQIKSEVERLIKGMKDAGASFIFASDHSISTNVDYQDFQYMLEVYRENMAM